MGLELVASYYTAVRHDDRFCWATHVCAPYLDEPASTWFDAGLPVVGYFHDREPALDGVEWVRKWLDEWQGAGASRMIDFRELSSAIGRRLALDERDRSLHLDVRVGESAAPDLVRLLPLTIRVPGSVPPPTVTSTWKGERIELGVERIGSECGHVTLAAASESLANSAVRPKEPETTLEARPAARR